MSARLCTLACLILALTAATGPAVAPPPRALTAADIDRLVRELGADEFDAREAASRRLKAAGAAAEAALEKAAAGSDREATRRALAILADLRWGIYPETPEAVADAIREYKGGGDEEKTAAVQKLVLAGPPGWNSVRRLIQREEEGPRRKLIVANVTAVLGRAVAPQVSAGDFTPLETFLDALLAEDPAAVMGHYTTFWLLRGELPARVARHQALAREKPADKVQQEILAYLFRAKGDLPAALKAAEACRRNDLIQAVLYELGDWKTLADRPELIAPEAPLEKLALRTAYNRLAGNTREFAALVAEVRKIAEGAEKDEKAAVAPMEVAKILFLNGHPRQALEEMARKDGLRPGRLDVLVGRNDFRAARALVEEARKAGSADLDLLEIAWARIGYLLGEKDEAVGIFKRLVEKFKKGKEGKEGKNDAPPPWLDELIDSELRCGLTDLAFEHAAALDDTGGKTNLLERLFPKQGPEAVSLHGFLMLTVPGTTPARALERTRAFLGGKATPKELAEVADLLRAALKPDPPLPGGDLVWLALGESAWAAKQPALARAYLEGGNSVRTLTRLGDHLARKEQWAAAAERYHAAYRLGTRDVGTPDALKLLLGEPEEAAQVPLALYLSGWALAKAGKAEAGRLRREQALWLPLGDKTVRSALVKALRKRDFRDDARRNNEILRKTLEPGLARGELVLNVQSAQLAAFDAAARKDHLASAQTYEQAMLLFFQSEMYFSRPVAYVSIPAFIHRQRVLGLLKAGRVDAALAEVGRAREAQPGAIDLPIELVDKLERAGRKKEAAQIYQESRDALAAVLKDYPRSGWACNSAAWLSACCRRDLDEGLKRARQAVELSPDSAEYLDTLAEVLFQIGRRDEAVAAQKRVVAMVPAKKYFRKQLARIEAGNPRADRPEEDEEEEE